MNIIKLDAMCSFSISTKLRSENLIDFVHRASRNNLFALLLWRVEDGC